MPYAWDYPAARDKKILLIISGARRVVDVMEIGDLVPFKFSVRYIIIYCGIHSYQRRLDQPADQGCFFGCPG